MVSNPRKWCIKAATATSSAPGLSGPNVRVWNIHTSLGADFATETWKNKLASFFFKGHLRYRSHLRLQRFVFSWKNGGGKTHQVEETLIHARVTAWSSCEETGSHCSECRNNLNWGFLKWDFLTDWNLKILTNTTLLKKVDFYSNCSSLLCDVTSWRGCCCFFIFCRRQQTEEPAVPSELGLDLLREAALRGGRGGQVPGSGAEEAGLPGRDLLR